MNHLVVFARQPRLGRVKTRLGEDVGVVAATAFYRRNMATVLGRLSRDPRWKTWISVTPDRDAADPVWRRWGMPLPQGTGDLGVRMQRPFEILPPGPVVIVGTDVPGITRDKVAIAFRLLGSHDAVFGPAEDGGYWLVGQRRRPTVLRLFDGVRWSTGHALEDTLANLPRGKSVAIADTLWDVDDGPAHRRWRQVTTS